ncbi:hypothetical protein BDV06DRAFT_217097 [Aspergillus oleicola]
MAPGSFSATVKAKIPKAHIDGIALHPEVANFRADRPFLGVEYDSIFCGDGVVKTHPREHYRIRSGCEGSRLTLWQLIFAFSRLSPGGAFVLLMHRAETWESEHMYAISRFADIQAFKSPRAHEMTSSFYLVAKSVDVQSSAAGQALTYWEKLWRYLTFREFADVEDPSARIGIIAEKVMGEFRSQFLDIVRPLWKIQRDKLRRAPFMKSA